MLGAHSLGPGGEALDGSPTASGPCRAQAPGLHYCSLLAPAVPRRPVGDPGLRAGQSAMSAQAEAQEEQACDPGGGGIWGEARLGGVQNCFLHHGCPVPTCSKCRAAERLLVLKGFGSARDDEISMFYVGQVHLLGGGPGCRAGVISLGQGAPHKLHLSRALKQIRVSILGRGEQVQRP